MRKNINKKYIHTLIKNSTIVNRKTTNYIKVKEALFYKNLILNLQIG